MIHFEKVNIKHSGNRGVFDINFKIKGGQFVYLMGPTGAGKSTILKAIFRFISLDSGTIYINGNDISKLGINDLPYYRRQIGMIFQDFKLLNDRTVEENIALPLQIEGAKSDIISDKVKSILNELNLTKMENKFPEELSGGEQQRVCIARALIKDPHLILADEPTGNLDPSISDDILDVFELASKKGITVIMATHNYPLIESRIEHFIELNDGRMVS